MTPEERGAEHIRSLAASVYRALDAAAEEEDYVRAIAKRHGEHPAFKQYLAEMLLTDRLAAFLARPEMRRA